MKCGQNLDYLGVVDLDMTVLPTGAAGSENKRVKMNYSFQLLCTDSLPIQPDRAVLQIIADYESGDKGTSTAVPDEVLSTVQPCEHTTGGDDYSTGDNVAQSLSTQTSDVRSHETAFACHVADAMKWTFIEMGYNCDLAIINGGFIRGDRLYPPGGPLMRSDMMQEMPFPRCPVLLRMTGSEILLGLEQMLSGAHAPVGSFPHLSAGISAMYDLKEEPMHRIKSVTIDSAAGAENDASDGGGVCWLSREYLVAVSDFYCNKEGDGVEAFTNKEVVARCKDVIGTVVSNYFRTLTFVSGSPQGRLVPVQRSNT